MSKFFISVYQYFQKRRFLFFGIFIVLFAVCILLASKIKLEEDISGFMPNTPETERSNFVLRNLSTNDKIIVKLSLKDAKTDDALDQLSALADTLVESMELNPGRKYIKDVFYKIDESRITGTFDFVLQNLPLYLKESDYSRLDSLLSPSGIQSVLEQNKKDLVSPMGMVYKKFIIADPLHLSNRVFAEMSKNAVDSLYKVNNGYIFSKDNKNLLIFITSAHSVGETGKNEVLARAIDKNIQKIKDLSGDKLTVTSFGAAIVGVSNASQIKRDSYLSTAISLVLILLLLGFFFKNIRSMLLLLVPVGFGVAFSLAVLAFLKGTISAIAVGAGSAILGIAINYTLHFLVHYKHSKSVEGTIKDLVSPLVVGSVTTIGAFLSLLFVSAAALRDFGLFAALALCGTILFVLAFMPHFINRNDSSPAYHPFFDRISEYKLKKTKWVFPIILLLTFVFGYFSSNITFESDMTKISYMRPDQKKAFDELSSFTNIAQKSIIHLAEGSDANEALTNYEKSKTRIDSLVKIRKIRSVSGVGSMLMSDAQQREKIKRWNDFWAGKKVSVRHEIVTKGAALGFKPNSFQSFFSVLEAEPRIRTQAEQLAAAEYAAGYLINQPHRSMVISLLYVDPQYEALVKKELSKQKGAYVFDRASSTKATINILSNDFNFVLMVCAMLVLVFLTISFGRFELSLLTFVPMVVAWIWILGLMGIFQVKFNIVNIILATFIFGLGDDYSIFILEGSMHEHTYKRKILGSYKLAVMLSALTMFIGIGSLIFAKHPAMKSLAQVIIIGMVSVVAISYTMVPLLYRWLTKKKGKKREYPRTIRNMINSVYAFVAFLIGSIILSLIGFALFKLTKANDRKKLFFHKCLAFAANFVVYRMPNVKVSLDNKFGESFDKPAVVICNHQSHIDLMLVMMLSPKIVILTNEWVWNSPFYGNIVKYADFYPVANGVENSFKPLSTLVEKGYSIMIFPEGTRSEDCSILRFHRGAFYLAEQLNLDILPVMIHGIGHALPKTDFLLRKGEVRVEVMERISPEDTSYGETYSQRAKSIRKMYAREYGRLAAVAETPSYYADRLYHNYIYKGAAVGTKVKIDLKKHCDYAAIIDLLPAEGRVLVLGSGYGALPLMLSMLRPKLNIVAVEGNEDEHELARNCASCTEMIAYINEDPITYSIDEQYDAIVLVDYLSTLELDQQRQLIERCTSRASSVLVSDIEYSVLSKIRLQLTGSELIKTKKINPSNFKQITENLNTRISHSGEVSVISNKA